MRGRLTTLGHEHGWGRAALGGAVLAFGVLSTAPAAARSQRLWTEREAASPPLAQVPDFRALADRVIPCVVSIQVEQSSTPHDFDFFHDMFRGQIPHDFHNRGIGTGFVIRDDGLILTNNHVVEGAQSIQVSLLRKDGTEARLAATTVGTAPEYDVALIRLTDAKGAKPSSCFLGDSERIGIGDWVMAVGNPFGLSHSVSVGIISAKGRREIAPSGRRGLYDFLQTDASINPGNSGGPLINMSGEVIGINTAINAAGSGIGFAIPINMVKTLLPSLQSKGKFVRSWIGIRIQPLDEALAASFGLERPRGALISEVVPGSPADKGGLRSGDIVLRFAGKVVKDQSDLPLYASMAGVGEQVELTLWRDTKELAVKVTLAAFPEDKAQAEPKPTEQEQGELGITVADITPRLKKQLDLAADEGIVIREVLPGSIAQRAGLRPGDLIHSINGRPVQRARDFAQVVREAPPGAHLRIQISRPSGRLFVALQKP